MSKNQRLFAAFRDYQCVKSFSGPYFLAFGLNTDQKNSEYVHFIRSYRNRTLTLNGLVIFGMTHSLWWIPVSLVCRDAACKIPFLWFLNIRSITFTINPRVATLQRSLKAFFWCRGCSFTSFLKLLYSLRLNIWYHGLLFAIHSNSVTFLKQVFLLLFFSQFP